MNVASDLESDLPFPSHREGEWKWCCRSVSSENRRLYHLFWIEIKENFCWGCEMEWLDNEREHAGLHSWETLMTVYERALSRCHLVWFIQNTPQKSLPAHSLVTAVECILSF